MERLIEWKSVRIRQRSLMSKIRVELIGLQSF